MKIRTLVIDDEPLARARIINLLDKVADIDLIGECRNGIEALELINTALPDLIFLDIQMPNLNGFEVINKLKKDEQPFVIFITAFDQYALKAFDVHATDYLLKPFDDDRFYDALEHARKQIQHKKEAQLNLKIKSLIDAHSGETQGKYISFKHKGIPKRINLKDIYWVQSDGNYLKLYLADKNFHLRFTLKEFHEKYEHSGFIRIHKAICLNKDFIRDLKYKGNNHYVFKLKNGDELTSGRSFKESILEYIRSIERIP